MGMQPMLQYLIDFHEMEMEQQKSQEKNIIEEETDESMGRMGECERSRQQLSFLSRRLVKENRKRLKRRRQK